MPPRPKKPQLYAGRTIGNWIFIAGAVAALAVLFFWPSA